MPIQTVTVQLTNQNALKALHILEEKHLIRIVEDSNIDSLAMPTSALALKAFKQWIATAEATDTVSLKDAKQKWTGKKKQLQKLNR